MNWAERQLLKCAAKDEALSRAEAIFSDWLTVPKHVVRPGEVLSGIARRHGVDLQSLMEFNGMRGPLGIRAGQVVRIPPRQARGKAGAGASGKGM